LSAADMLQTKITTMARQKLIILPKLCSCNGDLNKQWFVYFSCRDPRTGKMVRFRHYDGFTGLPLHAREEHALQLIEMFSARLRSGWTPFADDSKAVYNDHIDYKTVAEMYGTRRTGNNAIRRLTSQYLANFEKGVRHSTYLTYKSKLRIFVLWLESKGIALNDVATIDNRLIVTFFKYLIDDRKLSHESIGNYTELLFNLFAYFKKERLITYNPVFDIPACNRINDQAPRPIQRTDIAAFKKEIQKDPELWLAVQFMYYCGMRPGREIIGTKIKDIDYLAGTVHVDREHSKNGKDRIVTIPMQFVEALKQIYILHKFNRDYYIFGRGGHPGPEPIGKNKLSYKFRKIREKLKMPTEYKFYSWKHTGAIEADEAGMPHKDISNHLGHSNMSTTDIYFRNKKVQVSKAIRDNYPSL
jgi:integrase